MSPGTGTEFVAVYRSMALISHEKEIKDLVDRSRANNARLNISGILLQYDMNFLQVLEGEERVVRDLLEKIASDRRHNNLEVLFTQNAHKRVFQDWSMDLIDVSPQEFDAILYRLPNDGTLSKQVFSALQSGTSSSRV